MLRFRFRAERFVPVRDRGHFLQLPALIIERGVVKGNAEPLIALHQRGVQIVLVLVAEILFQQRIEDDEPGDLVSQNGVVTGRQAAQAGIGIQRGAPDGHDVDAVLGGRGQADKLSADLFAQGAELVAFLGNDVNDLPPLLPQTATQGEQRKGLARAGGAADPPVSVGVLVIIIGVQEHRRLVIHIESEKHAVFIAEFIRGKGE